MKPIRFLFYLIITATILLGCTAQQPTQGASPTGTPAPVTSPTSQPSSQPTQPPLPATPTAQPLPQVIVNVKEFLAKELGIQAEEISVVSFTAVEWPDSCLGIQTPGIMCAMIVTPGYKVFLQAGDKRYELHSNQTGQVVMLVGN